MGMDVFGTNPATEEGKYFRNNVWWWRPLWIYSCDIGSEIIDSQTAEEGHMNMAAGLNAEQASKLAELLQEEIDSGRTAQYESHINEVRASLPREDCKWCNATGIREDEVGLKDGHPFKELKPEIQILTGRTYGWCNACDGIGTVENWAANYPFSLENVINFVKFCRESGGFHIC